MTQSFVLLVIGLAGILAGYYLAVRRKTRTNSHIIRQQKEKERRKLKILELVRKRGTIKNDDVEKLLGVADSTATDYLDELEVEGKIYQVGARGKHVVYRERH